MNCNNDITQYIGSSTFVFDNITYNKVKVTEKWNRLGVRYFNNATKEVGYYNVYEIPVGEYSHTELFTAIFNCLQNFCTYTGIINVTTQKKTQELQIIIHFQKNHTHLLKIDLYLVVK